MKLFSQIVLLHGWGCDSQVWQPVLASLDKFAEIKTINIVYPKTVNANTIEDLCDQIAQQIDNNAILCGWSLGGMLATRIASLYPEKVKALITLATNPVFVANDHWPEAMPRKTFDTFFSSFSLNPVKALKRFVLLEIRGDKQADIQLRFLQSLIDKSDLDFAALESGLRILDLIDNSRVIKTLACPALFCFAENDTLVPISVVEKLKNTITDNQKLEVLAESGHLLHYPSEKIENLVGSFLLEIAQRDR